MQEKEITKVLGLTHKLLGELHLKEFLSASDTVEKVLEILYLDRIEDSFILGTNDFRLQLLCELEGLKKMVVRNYDRTAAIASPKEEEKILKYIHDNVD